MFLGREMISDIASALRVSDVLQACGIELSRRMPCPIHNGDARSFAIYDDTSWRCWSRDCGAGRVRDAINLLALLRHGAPLPDLPAALKRAVLSEAASIAGVDDTPPAMRHPVTRMAIPRHEAVMLRRIMGDTSTLDDIASRRVIESRQGQRWLLYLAVARSMGVLPARVPHDWAHYDNMRRYIDGGHI